MFKKVLVSLKILLFMLNVNSASYNISIKNTSDKSIKFGKTEVGAGDSANFVKDIQDDQLPFMVITIPDVGFQNIELDNNQNEIFIYHDYRVNHNGKNYTFEGTNAHSYVHKDENEKPPIVRRAEFCTIL